MTLFERVCASIVARRYWNGGNSVSGIAKAADKSETTIRRWLHNTGVINLRRKKPER